MKKLCKDTHIVGDPKLLAALTPRALKGVVRALHVKDYAMNFTWDWLKELAKASNVPLGSSAGIGPGIDRIIFTEEGEVKITFKGKKKHQVDRAKEIIMQLIEAILQGKEKPAYSKAYVLVTKQEVLFGMSDAERKKIQGKCRLYNIPTLVMYMLARMVHSYRQKIERGFAIGIGINFWSGGAWRLATKLGANVKGKYKYFTCDFSALDTTIKAHLLGLYSGFSSYYIDRKTSNFRLYKELAKITNENLTYKCVHFYDNIWRMVYGGMPSGAYETSHGDSWIVLFIFEMFYVWVGDCYPHRKAQIHDALEKEHLMAEVFGDDGLSKVPVELHDIINVGQFTSFVKEVLDMDTRDEQTYDSMLSVVDQRSGLVRIPRICHLGRFLIEKNQVPLAANMDNLPAILPFRSYYKTVMKFPFGSGSKREPRDYVLASLGMVYDSMGTNNRSYQYCYEMFHDNLKKCKNFDDVLIYAANKDTKEISNMLRKCNISMDRLKRGFPSQSELLQMHVLDLSRHYDRADPEMDIPTWD
jgi:hypothetical protein